MKRTGALKLATDERCFQSLCNDGSRAAAAALVLAACMGSASAGLFDDEEARKAILDLRQKNQAVEQKLAEETRRATEDTAQLRRSLIELQNQLEATRAEMAKLAGSKTNR